MKSSQKLDKSMIEQLIPHAGAMCLLKEVVEHNETQLTVLAEVLNDNPLLSLDKLNVIHTVEYAGQAIALHSALEAGSKTKMEMGVLAALNNVEFFKAHLKVGDYLTVSVEKIYVDKNKYLYDFKIEVANDLVSQGRLIVVEGK